MKMVSEQTIREPGSEVMLGVISVHDCGHLLQGEQTQSLSPFPVGQSGSSRQIWMYIVFCSFKVAVGRKRTRSSVVALDWFWICECETRLGSRCAAFAAISCVFTNTFNSSDSLFGVDRGFSQDQEMIARCAHHYHGDGERL